ncbi:MAG: hypothetical protein GY846_24945 [Deltaproteobacteria bacterium]|nr:hypothetical protein [Deltaproteobacteria bacterium]
MQKWVTPGVRWVVALAFLIQLLPFGSKGPAFQSGEPITLALPGASLSRSVEDPRNTQHLLPAKAEGRGSLNEEGNSKERISPSAPQGGGRESIRGGQGEWAPMGGQVPSVEKPLRPQKPEQPDRPVIPGVPHKSGPAAVPPKKSAP